MKYIIAVVLLVACLAIHAQSDKPPVITVQITPEERVAIDASRQAVADAQVALEAAKQKQSDIEGKVIRDRRDKLNIPWADCGMTYAIFAFAGSTPDDAKGYTAELRGSWIVFTRGYATCHGV